jgi:hypothetical protein
MSVTRRTRVNVLAAERSDLNLAREASDERISRFDEQPVFELVTGRGR